MYSLILHGRKSLVLRKWINSRASVKLVPNASAFSKIFFSSSASANATSDVSPPENFTISYLVDSLHLNRKIAESISTKISFEEKRNPDSVVNLFRSHGFSDSQISRIVMVYPQLLIADAEKSLGPKLQFLQSKGASSSSISFYYDFVRDVLQDEEEGADSVIQNVFVLKQLGVPQSSLLPLLNSSTLESVYGKDKFKESLKKVVEMGFDPKTSRFFEALRVFYVLKDKTIEEKVKVFRSLGMDVDDVWAMFKKFPRSLTNSKKKITQTFKTLKKYGLLKDQVLSMFKRSPQCIGVSERKILNNIETFLGLGFSRDEFVMMLKAYPQCITCCAESMKKKSEFLVKKMNWPLKSVVVNYTVFGMSMEERIVPRCNVIEALMLKGLLGDKESVVPPSLASVLLSTNEKFLKTYVRKQDDKKLVHELMAIFTRKIKVSV